MGEPGVPVVRSMEEKNWDSVEAIQRKLLFVPGEVTRRVLLTTGVPVPKTPIWPMGAGLQVPGWQIAVMEASPGHVAVIWPRVLTLMFCGSVEV